VDGTQLHSSWASGAAIFWVARVARLLLQWINLKYRAI